MNGFVLFGIHTLSLVALRHTCLVNGLSAPVATNDNIFTRNQFIRWSITTATITGSGSIGTFYPLSAEANNNYVGNDDNEYITTSRGLKYKVVKPPNDIHSPNPERAQKVKASYTLYLNGFPPEDTTTGSRTDSNSSSSSTKVDSSQGLFGDKPLEFLAGVSQVIKGWDLAIMDMKVGEARKLIVPSDLGYGYQGAGGKIPGGATLYFDVELVEIGPKSKLGPDQFKWLEEHPL